MKRFLLLASFAVLLGCGANVSTGGAGGAGGQHASTSTSTASTSTGSTSSGASTSGGGMCSPACGPGFTCCNGACVNTDNDILNCGMCGKICIPDFAFCGGGVCGDPPCDGAITCNGNQVCCGTVCCAEDVLCCDVPGPGPTTGPKCVPPQNGTCPPGCPACK